MNNIQFPLEFNFKISTISNDFVAKDASGNTIAYVRQKMFKFIEEIVVFNDESRAQTLCTIKANKWIDFSASYIFHNPSGMEIGRVARKGWASLWKARYEIFDQNQNQELMIQEENGWIKVFDSFIGQIPIVGMFTGFFLNPTYKIIRTDGTLVARLKKESSFFGNKFSVAKLSDFKTGEEERTVLGLMMMILLERRRG